MAWKFNWWSCSAQKVANSEASRCLRHLKCRSTSSFSPPRQILNHVEKTYCQKISNHKPWSTSPPALSPSLSLPALVSASTSIFSFAFFAKIRLWHSAESGKSSRKKVAVLLDFVQMRGGRALPNFFVHFSQTVYIGSIWGWGGRGRPLPKFFGTLASKKVVQVVQIRGRGGWGNLDKIQKNSYFFRESVP